MSPTSHWYQPPARMLIYIVVMSKLISIKRLSGEILETERKRGKEGMKEIQEKGREGS
jgi:hypothetical protein